MTKNTSPPPEPEQLFAEYHALRADSAAGSEAYDDLAKRVKSAKSYWKKTGDTMREQRLSDLQNYIQKFKPREQSKILTPEVFAAELRSLSMRMKKGSDNNLKAAVFSLWRRLEDTRSEFENQDPDYDDDHDLFTDGEQQLFDLASQLGIELTS